MACGDATIRIVFRGVRGSYPMPGPTTVEFGGNTTCQEIRVGGRLLVLDAGSGIISLGRDLQDRGAQVTMALFFSHNHHDHTGGLLFFKPAYNPATRMTIYGPREDKGTIQDALEHLASPAAHPVQLPNMGMCYISQIIGDGDVVLWRPGCDAPELAAKGDSFGPDDVVVRVRKSSRHPVHGVLNFRLEHGGKSYVYATDVEGDEEEGDPGLAAFAKGADLLAHDGQYVSDEYYRQYKGWGHSTLPMAIKTARLAGISRLAIIHHEPTHTDQQLLRMEEEAQKIFPGLFLAREGQVVDI